MIAQGRQRAGLLVGLSKTGWGIPPKLLKTLMTTTIHAATNYGVMVWLPPKPPNFFIEQMLAIDLTCARASLGALQTTPSVFLHHNLHLTPVKTRLQGRILAFMARSLTKPQSHPLFQIIQRSQTSPAKYRKDPFDVFFQHLLCKHFKEHITQLPVDPASTLIKPPNYSTLLQANEPVAKANALFLKPSHSHTLILTNVSRILSMNTTAAAWCANNRQSKAVTLGPEQLHRIYQAKYQGFQLGLQIVLETATFHTRQATIVLDN